MKKLIPLTLCGLVLLTGCSKRLPFRSSTDAKPVGQTALVEERDINFSVDITGDVTPDFQLDVRSEVGGKVKKLHVEPGQEVKKGDVLVEIDDTDLLTEKSAASTEIEGARLVVEKNRRNYLRAKELYKSNLIDRESYENISSDLAISENNLIKSERRLQTVEDKLRKTRILAPNNGTVLEVKVIEGQVVVAAASVNSGTSLLTIADLSKLLVDTHVNQVDVARLKLNQSVKLSTESLTDFTCEAVISFIAPVASVKNSIKGFKVEATIEHPDPRLRPGMTVNLSVPVTSASKVPSVPITAVFKGEKSSSVVYVRQGEGSEKRTVEIGVTDLDYAEVKSGLKLGEEVLLVEPKPAEKRS